MLDFDKDDVLFLLKGLTVYRRVADDDVIAALVRGDVREFTALLIENAHLLGISGDILGRYLRHLFLCDENLFSLACERRKDLRGSLLYEYAMKDLEVLAQLCEHADLDGLIEYYSTRGVGDIARFSMFTLENSGALKGVRNPDPVTFEDIIGLCGQKADLIKNTENFIAGRPANNVLLVGSRGNGKSSCVKALINTYEELRLVEVAKDQAALLPGLIEKLSERGKRFIIFMDDLSFEGSETQYKYLKSLLEGGAGARPDNVLFFATSNRRHIIRESWKDRDSDDDIHINDTINELMSLPDRFGLTLHFPHLNQEEYLNIVTSLAKKRGLNIDPDDALKWAAQNKRMSGRTAVQFLLNFDLEVF